VKADKAQAVKILEESAEVFSAWECCCVVCSKKFDDVCFSQNCVIRERIAEECADVIQAVCNLLAALGVDDLTAVLDRCKQKNIERGREYERRK
jgi:phosphoribosyl-ATP pyrophosphohydrolase